MNKKLNNKYTELMKLQLNERNIECAHGEANDLLCQLLIDLGYKDVIDIYDQIEKWYV